QELGPFEVSQVKAGTACIVGVDTFERKRFELKEIPEETWLEEGDTVSGVDPRQIHDRLNYTEVYGSNGIRSLATFANNDARRELLQIDLDKINRLRRCTRCVLPETFPFISFDEHGVCNICNDYKPLQPMGTDALLKAIEKYRKNTGVADCILPFSGGRDSS